MSVLKYLNDTQTARLWAKIKAGFVSKSGDTMTGALTLAGDPVSDLQAATKKYVDDNAGALPSQTGQIGKFLTTDGTDASWGTVDALPSQSGKNGKYLKTNGTAASWEDAPAQTAKIWTGYCTTARDAEAKVVVLDDPTGFSLSSNNRIAVKFVDGIELASNSAPTLNVNNTGALRLFSPGNAINTYNQDADKLSCSTQGTCLFSFNTGLGGVGGWVRETSGFVLSKAYSKAMSALPATGGTMTGALTLNGAPTLNLHAATKGYVDEAIGSVTGLSFEIVQSLPQTGDAGTIYLVPNSGSSPNIYDEYIYVANAWEKIGTTEIDLSGYVQTSRKVNNKALSADITLSASDVGALSTSGDGKSVTVTFTQASTRTNIATGTTLATAFSRISKWLADLGAMAFKSSVAKSDLASGVQDSLDLADSALQSYTETDPTVPSWAKASTKPSYSASEVGAVPTTRTVNGKGLSSDISLSASDVGALPSSTTIPSKTSQLQNNSGFLTLATLPIYDGTVV